MAAAGSPTPGAVALRIAATSAQPTGSPVWASALPGQFVDFFTLCSFSLLPFTSFLRFLSLVFLCGEGVRVLQYSFARVAVFRFPSRAHRAAGAGPTGKGR